MKKSTAGDQQFKKAVAEEFARARDRAKLKGFGVEAFVAKLGITRAALHKYLHQKSIPSLRVLEKAKKYWGVKISYGELGDSFIQAKKKDPRQLEFLFSLSAVSADQIQVKKFTPKGESGAELLISIDFRKRA